MSRTNKRRKNAKNFNASKPITAGGQHRLPQNIGGDAQQPLGPQDSQPSPKVVIPWRAYWHEFKVGALLYTLLVSLAAFAFFESPWLAQKALPFLEDSGKAVTRIAAAVPFIIPVTLVLVILIFATVGFAVIFPQYKSVVNLLPKGALSLSRFCRDVGTTIALSYGLLVAMCVGEALRLGVEVSAFQLVACFFTGLLGEALKAVMEVEVAQLYRETDRSE